MEIIPFFLFYERLTKQHHTFDAQVGSAAALGVHRSAITQAKNRNAVPHKLKWILALARRYQLSPDWLKLKARGTHPGCPRATCPRLKSTELVQAVAHRPASQGQEMVNVPPC